MKKGDLREFRDINHFRAHLRGRDTPAVQIEPGAINIRFRSVDLHGMVFSENRVNCSVIDHSRIKAGLTFFVINLSPAIFLGRRMDPGHLIILDSGREYRNILASKWHGIGIAVETQMLAAENVTLPLSRLRPEDSCIPLPIELVGIFRRLADTAFGGTKAADTSDLRVSLLRALGKGLTLGTSRRDAHAVSRPVEGYALTMRMIRQVEGCFGQRVSVNEIARHLDVTPRALHYAVRSTLGIRPLDLLLRLRLNHVRNELWQMRRSGASITSAALAQDFVHLGRFSQQYRALFGELPSQTLERTRLIADEFPHAAEAPIIAA
ncbi:helix-turn-helix domain-containing protein [Sphingopyxis sp. MWB1]|uniref:helix-turn-helix domain-containing protein n=1 Tax=Sphingopyxis sp. MWB1 TaxID=1537715 RepID=UPI00051A2B4B|nr:helix-turn-helix domain-containing protein [Sphingopyxis sp. MWB1]